MMPLPIGCMSDVMFGGMKTNLTFVNRFIWLVNFDEIPRSGSAGCAVADPAWSCGIVSDGERRFFVSDYLVGVLAVDHL